MRRALMSCLVVASTMLSSGVATAAPAKDDGFVARVLELTNIERQNAGLAPLSWNPQLEDAAQTYSEVLASSGCFAHTCGPVPNLADRDGQAGFDDWSAIGENIAAGYPTPEAVVAGWMASPAHRDNILSPQFTDMGVGTASAGDKFGRYWTQEFGAH